eukprot:1352037-Pyramimonas_sp.AAC.1
MRGLPYSTAAVGWAVGSLTRHSPDGGGKLHPNFRVASAVGDPRVLDDHLRLEALAPLDHGVARGRHQRARVPRCNINAHEG